MEEKVKEIIATFIRLPAEQIGPATPIDRSAVRSSIMLHRMYARLAEEGLVIRNYTGIRVFGDLNRETVTDADDGAAGPNTPISSQGTTSPMAQTDTQLTLGIDIEETGAMPRATDFRKEAFYQMNFTPAEMAYCILQPDPYASFAGLFAVKEAMMKSDGSIRGMPFNQIGIGHSSEGKPGYPGFTISISHAGGMVVAVAARAAEIISTTTPPTAAKASVPSWPAWLALLLSLAALLVALLH